MKRQLRSIFRTFLTGGMDPRKSSFALAVGLLWGVFPLIGTSTLLCTASAVLLRLNIALTNAVNYAVYPLQLVLIVPFFKLGSALTGRNVTIAIGDPATFSDFNQLTEFSGDIFLVVLNAILGWVLIVPATTLGVAIASRFVLEKRSRSGREEAPGNHTQRPVILTGISSPHQKSPTIF